MQTERVKFLEMLNAVKPGLATRAIFEQTTHFIFTGENVITYNDQICVCHPFKSPFQCSVKAEDLHKIVSNMREDLLRIDFDGKKLLVRTMATKARLSTVVDEEHRVVNLANKLRKETMENRDDGGWLPLPDDFVEGTHLCAFSASTDLTQGPLTCVSVSGLDVTSTDGYRASHYILKEGSEHISPFLIRAKDVHELAKFPITHYKLDTGWAHFLCFDSDVTFHTRRLGFDKNPDVKGVLDSYEHDETQTRLRIPDELKRTLNMVVVMAENENKDQINMFVNIELQENKMTVAASKTQGDIEHTMEIDYKRAPLKFTVNPRFLSQVLDKSTSLTLKPNCIMFTSGNFRHTILLPKSDDN